MAVPQLQLANLGEIYAQNQARQASMDNLMMQQQAMLEQRQAAQAAAQREAAIRQAIASGVDPSSREGLGQLLQAGLPLEQFQSGLKNLGDIELAKQRGLAAQAQADAAKMRGQAAMANVGINERKVNAQIAKWSRDSNLNAQRTAIAWQQMRSTLSQQQIEMGANASRALAGISDPKQRQSAYTQSLPILRQAFPDFEFPENVDDPNLTAAMAVMGRMGGKEQGTTGKPVAVIDPNTGQAVYVAPDQAIGKQVASTRTPGQTEEAKQRQKAIVKAEDLRSENAANAASIIDSLNRAEQLVASGAANTGPVISKLPTLSAGTAEFEAISNQLGLEGTKLLKGAISEMENKKVQSTQPGNDRTPESNLAIIKFNRSIMQRTVERAKFDSTWRQTKGTIEGADAAWRRFTQENPVTSSDPNDLSINEQNIGNWQGYITGEGKQTQSTTAGSGQGRVVSFEEFMSQ
jgi:hypothetical protein